MLTTPNFEKPIDEEFLQTAMDIHDVEEDALIALTPLPTPVFPERGWKAFVAGCTSFASFGIANSFAYFKSANGNQPSY